MILNKGWASCNLLEQQATEEGAGICLISEPPRAEDSSHRIISLDGRAAVLWRPENIGQGLQCTLVKKGHSYVATEVDKIWLVSFYISPNSTRGEYLAALDELGKIVHIRGATRIIVGGDFNARARTWDPYGVNNKGHLVEEWAAELDIRLINEGAEPTLINSRGASIIDLTWATPDLTRRIRDWAVSDRETLSDHRYIVFKIRTTKRRPAAHTTITTKQYSRWNFNKMDVEKFCLALEWNREDCPPGDAPAEDQAEWIGHRVREACDLAAPRAGPSKTKRQAYWWSNSMNVLRNTCNSRRGL